MPALIPVLTAVEKVAIQEATESKFVETFSIDSTQSLCWATLEPRQIDISVQYLYRHLERQAVHREVLFLSAKSSQMRRSLPTEQQK